LRQFYWSGLEGARAEDIFFVIPLFEVPIVEKEFARAVIDQMQH
jgi:hypothetical protein